MKIKNAQIAISLICVILGFMLSIQFKSVRRNTALSNTQLKRAEELQAELNKEREKNENLYKQLLQYEKDLNAYQKAAAESSDQAQGLLKQLYNAQTLAGLNDVEGPGVIVTLNDSKVENKETSKIDENYFIIHDDDILMVINELSDAGAEAISINDERLIATSEIRCAGNTISVNNNRYGTPFVIKAIGNPETLESGLNIRSGVVDILRQWGIEVTVKKVDKLLIKRFSGGINFKYATPVVTQQ